MLTTPHSLLERLKQAGEETDWNRFLALYSPLLLEWARRSGLGEVEAEELVQTTLVHLLEKLPSYRPRSEGSFRGWLFTVLRNQQRDMVRKSPRYPAVGDVKEVVDVRNPIDELTEQEYQQYLMRRILTLLKTDYPETTWQAFWRYVVEGKQAATVSKELDISINSIYLARGRILRRLRQELAGLLD